MQRVAVNGIEVAYHAEGSGAPLVLLHGTQADRRQFDSFLPLLGEGIRSIVYDQRDTLDSRNGDEAYAIADLATDCAALIESLEIAPAHVMGTSFGGAVAMAVTIDHPHVVRSLVLAATTPSWDMVEPIREIGVNVGSEAERDRFMLEVLLTPETIDRDATAVAEVRRALTSRTPEQMARRNAALVGHDLKDRIGLIEAPTLVLHGADDRIIAPSTARWMARRINGAQLHIVDRARHGITFERREQSAAAVRAFVMEHSA